VSATLPVIPVFILPVIPAKAGIQIEGRNRALAVGKSAAWRPAIWTPGARVTKKVRVATVGEALA
jgi:hypothetical protein